MSPDMQTPTDEVTILESTADFAAKGYNAQFAAMENAVVRCFACRADSPATAFTIAAWSRSEGASDPDDMVAVVAAACPVCEAKGTLTLKYGPDASLEEQTVLKALDTKS